jgi:acetyltransferase-like isoleucine patch superfamily enzyme
MKFGWLVKRVKTSMYWRRLYRKDIFEWRLEKARSWGVKIGKDCLIFSMEFSTEPYLIEIGDHVVISSGTQFITHDGSVWLLRDQYPDIGVFGRIKVGSNTFIGINCIILPNTEIGSNCIIGAGAAVRGKVPDDSVVLGNPGKVVMKTSMMQKFLLSNKNRLDTKLLTTEEKDNMVKRHFGIE